MNDISVNRHATFDYQILDTYEAGIELFGFEVKSVKNGHINLTGSFAVIRDDQAWLLNATISPHQPKNAPANYEPGRTRRLLLHKKEIRELIGKTAQKGLTLVPLKVYNKNGRIKILIGLGKHKQKRDKRETIKKRDVARETRRTLNEK